MRVVHVSHFSLAKNGGGLISAIPFKLSHGLTRLGHFVYNFSDREAADRFFLRVRWPVPGFEDTELGVFMEPEVDYGTTEVYAGVQA
jgi:hypothetical protein